MLCLFNIFPSCCYHRRLGCLQDMTCQCKANSPWGGGDENPGTHGCRFEKIKSRYRLDMVYLRDFSGQMKWNGMNLEVGLWWHRDLRCGSKTGMRETNWMWKSITILADTSTQCRSLVRRYNFNSLAPNLFDYEIMLKCYNTGKSCHSKVFLSKEGSDERIPLYLPS